MQLDPSAIDAQLAALGEPHPNAVQLARTYAGISGSLGEVDQALEALFVLLAREPARFEARSPGIVQPPKADASLGCRVAPAKPSSRPQEAYTDADEAQTALHRGPPESSEIALPAPVAPARSELSQSGEIPLAPAAPQSGAFTLADPDGADRLDEDGDADFEAEFAALSNVDHSGTLPRPVPQPAPNAQASDHAASEASQVSRAGDPASPAAAALPDNDDDDETNAVLSLFDAMDGSESTPASPIEPTALAPSSPAPRPSVRASSSQGPCARDPDAEFDALFDEASSPSGLPPSPEADADSVDDLLRDLGSPAVPTGLGPKPSAPHQSDADLDDPTEIFDMRSLDSMPPSVEARAAIFPDDDEIPSSEFEIVIDDLTDADDVTEALADGANKPTSKPPKLPEARQGILGRLFKGGSKDSSK